MTAFFAKHSDAHAVEPQAHAISHRPPSLRQRLAERERPDRTAVMRQRWEQLLFLHWRFEARNIQQSLPLGLYVDTFDGDAWVGLVPIFMRDVRPSFVPPIPYISDFLELNLRTYVYDVSGKPGIYFYSLACNQRLVVETARRLLELNYEHSAMSGEVAPDGQVTLTSRRPAQKNPDVFVYRHLDEPMIAANDSLEFFLVERYRLFAGHRGRQSSIRVHHEPYRLKNAALAVWGEQAFRLAGLPVPNRRPDHICAADTLEVEVFPPEAVARNPNEVGQNCSMQPLEGLNV
jgi:uncharacterized protein YqjF (DUF2071 family)